MDSDLAAVERRERGVELSGFLAGPYGRYIMMAISVALVAVSASIHEFAHGWMALRCGDPTAKEAGRLTLNPLAHLDPFGSFMLPLMMALAGMPVFAAAKPVPFNPRRLNNPARDEALVALAGPVSNIIQALVAAALLYLVKGKDLIPDGLPLVGFVDDLAVVTAVIKLNEPEIEAYKNWKQLKESSPQAI